MNYEIKVITEILCNYYKEKISDVFKYKRKERFIEIRRMIFYFCCEKTKFSHEKISEELSKYGYKFDRCTVYFHHQKALDFIDVDKQYSKRIEFLSKVIDKKLQEDNFDEIKTHILSVVEKSKNMNQLMNAFLV